MSRVTVPMETDIPVVLALRLSQGFPNGGAQGQLHSEGPVLLRGAFIRTGLLSDTGVPDPSGRHLFSRHRELVRDVSSVTSQTLPVCRPSLSLPVMLVLLAFLLLPEHFSCFPCATFSKIGTPFKKVTGPSVSGKALWYNPLDVYMKIF